MDVLKTVAEWGEQTYRRELLDMVYAAVDARNFGKATARKTGRRAEWPYVPVIDHRVGWNKIGHVEQIKGLAYATRGEAIASAQRQIDRRRAGTIRALLDPRDRAFRRQLGLPFEIGPYEIEPDDRLDRRRAGGFQ